MGDVDAREIGKNYPVSVPLLGDAREALKDLLDALGPGADGSAYRQTSYFEEIQRQKQSWFEQVEILSGSEATPMTMARNLARPPVQSVLVGFGSEEIFVLLPDKEPMVVNGIEVKVVRRRHVADVEQPVR